MNTAKIATYLTNILTEYEYVNNSRNKKIRCLGAMEGLLLAAGIFSPKYPFDYKTVTVENPSVFAPWFPGTSATIIRKETFEEMILRHAKLYIMLHDAEEDSL